MKKFLFLLLTLTLSFGMVACDGSNESKEQAELLDLTGTWVQTNSNSEDAWQEAVISDGIIEINWVSDGGDTKSLYWVGSYDAPTEAVNEYVWTSNNDTEKTEFALLASSDETKNFTYTDGELSYEASALGTKMIIRMEKQ